MTPRADFAAASPMMYRRSFMMAIMGIFGWKPDDLCLRLAYSVLYDKTMFEAAVKDAVLGVPRQNGAWVAGKIAAEHDKWVRGELAPLLKEYFRRVPWRRGSFPEYKGVLYD